MLRVPLLIKMLLLSAAVFCIAQQPPRPGEDISGMYSFLRDGEFVQVNVHPAPRREVQAEGPPPALRVSGFISRLGDVSSNRGAVLDHFFTKGSLRGEELSFTTRAVHGIWFEFTGRAERGTGADPTEDGYFVLRGKLTRFVEDAAGNATSSSREVTLSSFPVDALDDP